MPERTRIEIADGIARITLDDGKVNALSSEMLAELGERLDAAEKAGAVVALRGREGVFSGGFDLKTFQRGPEATVEMVRRGADLVLRLLGFPRPILAVSSGHAIAAGSFVLMACDVRFGLAGPFQAGLNETAIGLTVPKFVLELARHRLTPAGFARVPSAVLVDPEEALRLGYLDRVLPAEQLDAAVESELARLRALDATAFTATKARVHERALRAIAAAVDEEMRGAGR